MMLIFLQRPPKLMQSDFKCTVMDGAFTKKSDAILGVQDEDARLMDFLEAARLANQCSGNFNLRMLQKHENSTSGIWSKRWLAERCLNFNISTNISSMVIKRCGLCGMKYYCKSMHFEAKLMFVLTVSLMLI
jgi:hypothetical protein